MRLSKNDAGMKILDGRLKKRGFKLSAVVSTYDLLRDAYFVRFYAVCPCGGEEAIDIMTNLVDLENIRDGLCTDKTINPIVETIFDHIKDDVRRGTLSPEWLS